MLVGVNKREWVPMAMKRKLTGIAHYNRREKKTETVESFWLQSGMHAFWLNNKLTHIISHPKQSYFILKEIYDFFVPIFKSTRYIENRFTRYIYTNAHTHRIPRRSFLKRQPSDCWGICVAEPRPPCWRRLFLHLAFFFVSEKKINIFVFRFLQKWCVWNVLLIYHVMVLYACSLLQIVS